MEKQFKKINLLLTALIIIALILLVYLLPQFVGYVVKEPLRQVQFYFYDELTACKLDGYVFIGDKVVGKSSGGIFNLTYGNYIQNFQNSEEISVFGKLGSCFTESRLFFDKYWENFEIDKEYFLGESLFNFSTEIKSSNPARRELIGFIQPSNMETELSNIDTRENKLDSLSEINDYLNNKITYEKDWEFEEENYWQTPTETLGKEKGDCEDYSSTLLSLFLAYNPELNCYNIIFSSHVTTFCHIGNYFIYYDQGKTELKKQIIRDEEIKSRLLELNKEYFEHYGLNETKAYYAFNDNKFVEFGNDEEFVEWQSTMKKEQYDIFENIEEQMIENLKEIPDVDIEGELHTQTVSLPTKKFNFPLILLLAGILVVLVIILIVVNKRK